MKPITETVLHELYEDVLAQEQYVIENNCDNIADTMGYELQERFDIPAYTVKAPVNKKKHFVCLIPGEYMSSKPDTEFIIIDGALTQFSEDHPQLNIIPKSKAKRYDSVREPDYTLPESTSETQDTLDDF